jgi:hypothetical protein
LITGVHGDLETTALEFSPVFSKFFGAYTNQTCARYRQFADKPELVIWSENCYSVAFCQAETQQSARQFINL